MESFYGCLNCGRLTGKNGICGSCQVPYGRAWCVGDRTDNLHRLIDVYKFEYHRAAAEPLSELLAAELPILPPETIIVPIPTIDKHIRQRGYDHTALLAKQLARLKQCRYERTIERKTQTVQRDASRSRRIRQAKETFHLRKPINPDIPYLIVDDIVTTGSTLKYAAKVLRDAGAREIWVAALARQVSTK